MKSFASNFILGANYKKITLSGESQNTELIIPKSCFFDFALVTRKKAKLADGVKRLEFKNRRIIDIKIV